MSEICLPMSCQIYKYKYMYALCYFAFEGSLATKLSLDLDMGSNMYQMLSKMAPFWLLLLHCKSIFLIFLDFHSCIIFDVQIARSVMQLWRPRPSRILQNNSSSFFSIPMNVKFVSGYNIILHCEQVLKIICKS